MITFYGGYYIFHSTKGSDASWENDEEPPRKYLDYSDDEDERKNKSKNKKKKNSLK